MMITLTHRTLIVSASDCSLDSPDDGMGDGSSHDAFEPKEVAFSTRTTKGRDLLNSEVWTGNIVGELAVDKTIEQ